MAKGLGIVATALLLALVVAQTADAAILLPAQPMPEPSALLMLCAGLAGLAAPAVRKYRR